MLSLNTKFCNKKFVVPLSIPHNLVLTRHLQLRLYQRLMNYIPSEINQGYYVVLMLLLYLSCCFHPRSNCHWWKGVVILLLWGRQLLVLLSPHFLLALPFPFFVPLPFPLSHQVLYPHASCQLYLWTINASMVQSGRPILRVGWVPLAPCQKEKQVVEDFVTMAILSLQIGNKRR